ncbi:MAG: hypothetical protein FJ098_14345, partial [Deltaproteobacteria bacterium]|nr:hypothetical protein [Deltaproteobacteria bacterium]
VILGTCIIACARADGSGLGSAEGGTPPAADPDAQFYSFVLSPGSVSGGHEARLTVTVVPAAGWKWNEDYPAKFALAGEGITLARTEFKKVAGDLAVQGRQASFSFAATATAPGPRTLTVTAGFSVCNDTSCKIFRAKTIPLKLDVN